MRRRAAIGLAACCAGLPAAKAVPAQQHNQGGTPPAQGSGLSAQGSSLLGQSSNLGATETELGTAFTLSADVLVDFDQAGLKPAAMPQLQQLLNAIRPDGSDHPEGRRKNQRVDVLLAKSFVAVKPIVPRP